MSSSDTAAPMEDVKSTNPAAVIVTAVAAVAPDTSKQNNCLRLLHTLLKEQKREVKNTRDEMKAFRVKSLEKIDRHSRFHDALHELLRKVFPAKPKNGLQQYIAEATKAASDSDKEFKADAAFIKKCNLDWKALPESVKRDTYQARYMEALQNYVTAMAKVDLQAVRSAAQQLSDASDMKDEFTTVVDAITKLLASDGNEKKSKKRRKPAASDTTEPTTTASDGQPPAAKKRKKSTKNKAAAVTVAAVADPAEVVTGTVVAADG